MTNKEIIEYAGRAAMVAFRPAVPNVKVRISEEQYGMLRNALETALLKYFTLQNGVLDENSENIISDVHEKQVVNENADNLNRGSYGTDSVYHVTASEKVEDEENRSNDEEDLFDAEFKSEPTKNVHFTQNFLRTSGTYLFGFLSQMTHVPVSEEAREALNNLERMLRICLSDRTYFERNRRDIEAAAAATGFNAENLLKAAEDGTLTKETVDTTFDRYSMLLKDRYDIPAVRNRKTGGYTMDLPVLFNIARCIEGMAIHHGTGASDVFGLDSRTAAREARFLQDTAMSLFTVSPETYFLGSAAAFSEYLFPGTLNPDGKVLTGDGKSTSQREKPSVTGEEALNAALTDRGGETRRAAAEEMMSGILEKLRAEADAGSAKAKADRGTFDFLATNLSVASAIMRQVPGKASPEALTAFARYNELVGKVKEGIPDVRLQEAVAPAAERFASYLDARVGESREMLETSKAVSELCVGILKGLTIPAYQRILNIHDDKRTHEQREMLARALKIRDFWGRLDRIGYFHSASLAVSRYWNARDYLARIDAALAIGPDLPPGFIERMTAERDRAEAMVADQKSVLNNLRNTPVSEMAEEILSTYAAFFNADSVSRGQKGDRNTLAARATEGLGELEAEVSRNMAENPSYYEENEATDKEKLLAALVRLKESIGKVRGYERNTEPSVELHRTMAEAVLELTGDVSAVKDLMNLTARTMFSRARSSFESKAAANDLSEDRRAFGKLLNSNKSVEDRDRLIRFDNGEIVLPEGNMVTTAMLIHYGLNAKTFGDYMRDCRAKGVPDKEAVDTYLAYNISKMRDRLDESGLKLNALRVLAETAKPVPSFQDFLRETAETAEDKANLERYLKGFERPEPKNLPAEPEFRPTMIKTESGYVRVNPSKVPGAVSAAYTELDEQETILQNFEEAFVSSGGRQWLESRRQEHRASGDSMPFGLWAAKNDDGSEQNRAYLELLAARDRYENGMPLVYGSGPEDAAFRNWLEDKRAEHERLRESRSYDHLINLRREDAHRLQDACSSRAGLVDRTKLKDPDLKTARKAVMDNILKPFCENYVTDPVEMGILADYLADILANGEGKGAGRTHARARMILEGLPYNFQGYFRGDGSVAELGLKSSPMEKFEESLRGRISKADSLIRLMESDASAGARVKVLEGMRELGVPDNVAESAADGKIPAGSILRYAFRNPDAREILRRNDIPAGYARSLAERIECSAMADLYLSEPLKRQAKEGVLKESKTQLYLEECVEACTKSPGKVEALLSTTKDKLSALLETVNNAKITILNVKTANSFGNSVVLDKDLKAIQEAAEKRNVNTLSKPGLTDGSGFGKDVESSPMPGGKESGEEFARRNFNSRAFGTVNNLPPMRIVGAGGLTDEEVFTMLSARRPGAPVLPADASKYLTFENIGNDKIVGFRMDLLSKAGAEQNANLDRASGEKGDIDERKHAAKEIQKLERIVSGIKDLTQTYMLYRGAQGYPVSLNPGCVLDFFNPSAAARVLQGINRDAAQARS